MILGPISHRPGTSAGVPQHLRGRARLVIDSTMTGPNTDLDSAAAHTIEGLEWTASSDSPTTAVAGAAGTQASGNSATSYELRAEIPGAASTDLLCLMVDIDITTMAKNSQTMWIKLAQGTGETAEDVIITYRRTSASSYRFRPGYRNTSGSYSLGYLGDNPTASSVGRIQLMLYGHGNVWRAVCGTDTTKPGFNGVTAAANATGRVVSRSAGSVAGATPPLMRYIKIGWNFYSGDLNATVKRVILYRAGIE